MRSHIWILVFALLFTGCTATQQCPSEEPLSSSQLPGRPMVITYGESGGCVVTRAPEMWSKTTGVLYRGYPVLVLETEASFAHVEYPSGKQKLRGWVLIRSLGEYLPPPHFGQDGYARERASAGSFRPQITVSWSSVVGDRLEHGLRIVDRFEAQRNELLGGDPVNPDPLEVRRHYERFGEQGGLSSDR